MRRQPSPCLQIRGEKWALIGSDSPTKPPRAPLLALFHTTRDMMVVILRIDFTLASHSPAQTTPAFVLLSYLVSMNILLMAVTLAPTPVWHTGCPSHECEGLRVLGTSQKTGWGLGITEIGRTGISSPYNCSRRGCQANPQQITRALTSDRMASAQVAILGIPVQLVA